MKVVTVRSYRDLIVWQRAMGLVDLVYKATKKFPKEELFGLSLQLRRAAVSVPSNIAEGQGRRSTKEFLRHLSISYGSLMETETQVLIAETQGFTSPAESSELLERAAEVGRMINGLETSLRTKLSSDALAADH